MQRNDRRQTFQLITENIIRVVEQLSCPFILSATLWRNIMRERSTGGPRVEYHHEQKRGRSIASRANHIQSNTAKVPFASIHSTPGGMSVSTNRHDRENCFDNDCLSLSSDPCPTAKLRLVSLRHSPTRRLSARFKTRRWWSFPNDSGTFPVCTSTAYKSRMSRFGVRGFHETNRDYETQATRLPQWLARVTQAWNFYTRYTRAFVSA